MGERVFVGVAVAVDVRVGVGVIVLVAVGVGVSGRSALGPAPAIIWLLLKVVGAKLILLMPTCLKISWVAERRIRLF